MIIYIYKYNIYWPTCSKNKSSKKKKNLNKITLVTKIPSFIYDLYHKIYAIVLQIVDNDMLILKMYSVQKKKNVRPGQQ